MKKLLVVLLLISVVFCSAFATDPEPELKNQFAVTTPTFANRANRTEYGLFVNPASLAGGKFQLTVGVDARAYYAGEILSKIDVKNFDISSVLGTYLGILPMGNSNLLNAQGSLFLGIGNFALGAYVDADVDAAVAADTEVIPNVYGGVALGFAFSPVKTDLLTVDGGVSAHLDIAVPITKKFSLNTLSELENFSVDELMQSINPMFGLSFDVGANVKFFDDLLTASVSVTDIAPFGYWKYQMSDKKIVIAADKDVYNQSFKVNLGASAKASFVGFNAMGFVDFTDILNLKTADKANLLAHVNLGATLDFAGFIKASAALYAGAPEFGVGVDIFGNEVDVIYKVEDCGKIGQKTQDSLSVRVRVGFDTNR